MCDLESWCRCVFADVLFDFFDQSFRHERLHDVAGAADHLSANSIEDAVLTRQHDDGNVPCSFVLSDQAAELIAVESRHVRIKQNQTRFVTGDFLDRCDAVERRYDLVAAALQGQLYELANRRAVVNDEDCRCHFAVVAAGIVLGIDVDVGFVGGIDKV